MTLVENHGRRLSRRWLLVPMALLSTHCGAATDTDSPSSDETGVATVEEPLRNGYVLSDENYTGIVALQVWSQELGSYATFCTGTLMRNNKVLTAAHCQDSLNRTIYAKMGTQRISVSQRQPHPSSIDVAVMKLSSSMTMWNWSYNRFLTSPAAKNKTHYARGIYSGSNESLNGAYLMCWGHGGANWETGPYQPPLKYGVFVATYPGWGTGRGGVKTVQLQPSNPSNATTEGGDSGGPCLDDIPPHQSRIATVHSAILGLDVGAGDWGYWAAATIASL